MTPADFAPAASKKALLRMCATLCAAVLGISLLPQLATAAAAGFSVQMRPQTAGNTAAMSGQRVIFDGAAPAGATSIQSGEWLALDADGQEIAIADANKEYVPSGALNAVGVEGVTQNDFIRIENGSFVGQLTLPACTYSDPARGCAPEAVHNAVLRLTVATAGGSTVGDSTAVPVDYTRPRITRFEVVATDRVRVVFSEAVRMPPRQVELASDWLVDDEPGVAAVEGAAEGDCRHSTSAAPAASGCTRTLVLAQAVGEDATPMVEYTNSLSAIPDRIPYIDAAGLRLAGAIGFGATESIDRIRPAAPNIETVAGEVPSGDNEVISSVSQPTVVLTNLTSGHSVALSFTRNGTTTTMEAVEVPPGANSLELTPSLPVDETYVFSAVATDGAGNTSNEQDKNAARGDGNSTVTYVLDTVAPKIDSAHFVNRRTVTIKFTEPVAPAKNAGQWMIGEDPAKASGEGATRELTAQVDTTSGAGVTWSPTNGSTYTDRAENAMVAVEGFPLSDLPAVPAPTVTTPERQLATTASKVTIAGTAPSDNQYLVAELFERNGETPLMEASAAGGSWTFEHTVPAEQRTQLQVRLRDTKTFVTSPRVNVADIVHDTKAPVVDVLLPAGQDLLGDPEQFGVGDSVTITWTATDHANDPKDADHSRTASIFVDGAESPIASGIAVKPGTEQSFTYTLKAADLAGERVRDLAFRVEVDDIAGNTGDDLSGTIRLLVSTTVADPTVTAPAQQVFTAGSTVTITGTSSADSETNEHLDAQLFKRGGDTPLATTSAAGGTWTFDHTPAKDQRSELQVRLRDRDTGITSRLVSVPDIVHDATAPVVDVRLPASADILGRPQEFGVGDVVTITWVATDKANDAKQPDHSKTASVFKVAGSSSTAIKTGIVAQPGQEQTVTYTLTESDLGGQGLRDLTFRVDVSDRANNIGSDVSATIRLLGDRIGYTPVLTAPGTIEVEFAERMQGPTVSTDWTVDGQSVLLAEAVDRDGTTVVVLHMPLATDPNATPGVQFTPTLPATQRLRSMNDSQITLASRTAIDRTLPALKVERPNTPDVIDADRIRFTGTTDVTDRPNTIVAYYADAAGNSRGPVVASGGAGKDGAWQLHVPLVANRRNRIVFRAVDPSNNRSDVAPVPHFSVIEDSTHPVVTSLTPRSGATVGPVTTIRWKTVEAHRGFARLQYRLRSASTWKTIASKTSDDGFYRWTTPRTLGGRQFLLRVASFDKTGKRGALTSSGLRADFVRPEIRFARTIAPKKVRVVFTEAVRPTRARDFTVDGRAVRRMRGSGNARTLVLYRAMTRTTPIVAYDGRITTDRVGNVMRAGQEQALRGFVFPVTDFDAKRVSPRSTRLTWDDDRNRPTHLRGYRIFRDGRRIAQVGRSVRSFRERVTGSHLYVIRAVDDRGRLSFVRGNRVR